MEILNISTDMSVRQYYMYMKVFGVLLNIVRTTNEIYPSPLPYIFGEDIFQKQTFYKPGLMSDTVHVVYQ